MASQMESAAVKNITIDIDADGYIFKIGSSKIEFDGFLKVYTDDEDEAPSQKHPDLKEGDVLKLDNDASEDLIVRVNGERKFYARAGKIKEKICVKITDRYDYYVDALKRYF